MSILLEWNLGVASIVLGEWWCWLASTSLVPVVGAFINIIMTAKLSNLFQN